MVNRIVATPLAALLVVGWPLARSPLAAQSASEIELCERQLNPTRWPDARAQAQAAVRAAPGSALAEFYLGCVALGADDGRKAEGYFEKAIRATDRSAAFHFYLGQALGSQALKANMLKQGMLAPKVKREFERAVALDPNFIPARQGLISFYLQAPGVMGGSPEKAAQQAVEIKRRDAYVGGFAVASVALQRRDTAAALREYEALATQFADSAAPHTNVIAFLLLQKRHDDAWRAADRVARGNEARPYAQYMIGRVAAESGKQLERGEQELRRYIARGTPPAGEPALANAHWRLGTILEKRGQREPARGEYQTALRLNPKLDGAKQALARLK